MSSNQQLTEQKTKSLAAAESKGSKLKTTADLRTFLADMMIGVKNGHLDLDAAARITKLAAQVNESMYAEIKVARILADTGKDMGRFGELRIGKNED